MAKPQNKAARNSNPKAATVRQQLIVKNSADHSQKAQQAVALFNQGRLQEVEAIYRELIAAGTNIHIVYGNLGAILLMQGKWVESIEIIRKALDLKPNYPEAHNNLGFALQEQGELTAAVASYKTCLQLKPNFPEAHNNLGFALKEQGDLTDAIASYSKALELKPNYPDAHNNMGVALQDQGDLTAAIASYNIALKLNPTYPDIYNNLGVAFQEQGDHTAAIASYSKALELKPNYPDAYYNLGTILRKCGELEDSQISFSRASELNKSDLCLRLTSLAQIDDIQFDRQSIINQRRRFHDSILNALEDRNLAYEGKSVSIDTFYLPYHNESDDKEMLSQICEAFSTCKALSRIICKEPLVEHFSKNSHERLKVGFYFDNPQEGHSVHKLFAEMLRSLTNTGIETWVITPPKGTKEQGERLIAMAFGSLRIPRNIPASIDQIRALDLDVLIYTEITSSWYPYILSLSRLARVQVGTWGNPVTTGSDTMDYYLSSVLIEPTNGKDQYRERLITLNKLPSIYKAPNLEGATNSRSRFSLPSDQCLIGIPQSLFKFHPDYDKVLEAIISRLSNAKYVLIEGQNKLQTDRLKARWAAKVPKVLQNSIFLDRMPEADYFCLLETVDILLDPIYFGSGNTFYESMAVGTPLVTMPGGYMRGRIVTGGYKQMKLENAPIASTLEEYIEITVRLAEDPGLRKSLKQQIKAAAQKHLFDDQEAVEEIIEFIRAAVECNRKLGGVLPVDWKPSRKAGP